MESLNPGQQVVKIVNEELTELMGESARQITFSPDAADGDPDGGPPGLGQDDRLRQSSLACSVRRSKKSVALAACDVYRPAAVEQLVKVGAQAGATVYEQGTDRDPRDIAEWALDQARRDEQDVLIVDTSGRLHVDQELMKELADIKKRVRPHNVLLVVDAMTGQDAVNVAEQFAETAQFDGVVMTKLDGDARGGAALSIKAVTGKPILYASTRREAGRVRAVPPGPDGVADPRHGRRAVVHREGGEDGRRGPRRRSSSARSASRSSASTTSSTR